MSLLLADPRVDPNASDLVRERRTGRSSPGIVCASMCAVRRVARVHVRVGNCWWVSTPPPRDLQCEWTPLHFAAFRGSLFTVSLLLDDPRVDTDAKDNVSGWGKVVLARRICAPQIEPPSVSWAARRWRWLRRGVGRTLRRCYEIRRRKPQRRRRVHPAVKFSSSSCHRFQVQVACQCLQKNFKLEGCYNSSAVVMITTASASLSGSTLASRFTQAGDSEPDLQLELATASGTAGVTGPGIHGED